MNHIIISCTKNKAETTVLWRSLDAIKDIIRTKNLARPKFRVHFYINNTKGLSEVYNNALDKYKNEYDSIVFIHDDVEVVNNKFLLQLEEAYNHFDIVGLAGCLDPVVKAPALWHLMASRDKHRGAVGHVHNGNKFATEFGPSKSRVCLIDGLFMAFKMDSIKKTNFKFDENFTFHHYDLSACLIANKEKLKIGVWDIPVYHLSPGLKNYNDPVYQKSQEVFLKLYS